MRRNDVVYLPGDEEIARRPAGESTRQTAESTRNDGRAGLADDRAATDVRTNDETADVHVSDLAAGERADAWRRRGRTGDDEAAESADASAETRRAVRRAEERYAGGGEYGPGAAEAVTLPRTDERRLLQRTDRGDPADVPIDPEVLRDGGPTRGQGAVTTTGGTAGPASVRRVPRVPERHRGRVAPTTTGDATSGGFTTPARGATSDQVSQAGQVGDFTDDATDDG